MNNQLIVEGIIIKKVTYGENDEIITALTKNGYITFKARGILKLTSKNASSCLLYSYSQLILEEKNNKYYLSKGKLINFHYKLYDNIDNMTLLGLVSESLITFIDQINEELFNSFKLMLEGLDNDFDIYSLALINLAKIIFHSGYGLNISSCTHCESKEKIVALNYHEGGFLCIKCANKNDYRTAEYLKTVRYLFLVKEDKYFHHVIDKDLAILLIKEFINYLQEQFGFKKLSYFELFNQLFV